MAGFTFRQLHEKTGMARNSMPKYEADKTPVRAHTIMAYAMATKDAFGLEAYEVFEWLVYGDKTHDVPADTASDLRVSDSLWRGTLAPVHPLRAAG